jgi:3-isopropylmalate dehydrogenase
MTYRIGIIGGDGIGPEVTAEALKVARAAGADLDTVDFDLGGTRYLRDGVVLPDDVLDEWRGFDALLFGAVGTPGVPPGVIERGLLLRMRFALDLYINLRPFKSGPNRHNDGVDFLVVRENTEGTYAGEGGLLRTGTPNEIATQGSVNTRLGVERCVRFAFELARARDRRHLTLVHKTNVLAYAGDLWQRTMAEAAKEFGEVAVDYCHVDAATMFLVTDPERFDVIVTDNLFGDILTDLGAAVAGGIGLAASGNINPEGTAPSMFEPVHGSAPDIAGQSKADPTAAILSAAMLCEHLGLSAEAARIEQAVAEDLVERQGAWAARTTVEVGDDIAERVAG